jgi:putative membrane protein
MRRCALLSGLVLLALIWAGPLLAAWRDSFAAHMLAHMGVVALAAPLVAIGLSGGHGKERGVDATSMLLSLPIIASLVELVVVWAWHAPAMRRWAEASTTATVMEQAMFLAAGLFLWLACIGTSNAGSAGVAVAGAFGLLVTSIHMTLLGALLALSPRPLYGLETVTCFGLRLGAQQDQALGGVIMLAIGASVYLAGGVALLGQALRERLWREAN